VDYRLVFTRRAARDLEALEPDVRKRIGKALERCRQEPLRYARRMAHMALGGYRFRVGDYRIIFDMEGEEIVVLRVGHRSHIYRRS
jgi:mRNA interferase RelE/StbE